MRRVSSHNAGHTGCRTGVANDGNGDCTGPTDARDFGAVLNCRIAPAVDLSLEPSLSCATGKLRSRSRATTTATHFQRHSSRTEGSAPRIASPLVRLGLSDSPLKCGVQGRLALAREY